MYLSFLLLILHQHLAISLANNFWCRCGALLPGDQILAVNDICVEDTKMTAEDVNQLLWTGNSCVLQILPTSSSSYRGLFTSQFVIFAQVIKWNSCNQFNSLFKLNQIILYKLFCKNNLYSTINITISHFLLYAYLHLHCVLLRFSPALVQLSEPFKPKFQALQGHPLVRK